MASKDWMKKPASKIAMTKEPAKFGTQVQGNDNADTDYGNMKKTLMARTLMAAKKKGGK